MNEGDLPALLRQHAARHGAPGAAIGILRDGVATTAYCGVADVRTGEPVTSDGRPHALDMMLWGFRVSASDLTSVSWSSAAGHNHPV